MKYPKLYVILRIIIPAMKIQENVLKNDKVYYLYVSIYANNNILPLPHQQYSKK